MSRRKLNLETSSKIAGEHGGGIWGVMAARQSIRPVGIDVDTRHNPREKKPVSITVAPSVWLTIILQTSMSRVLRGPAKG